MNQTEQDYFNLMVEASKDIEVLTDANAVFARCKRFIRDATKGEEHSTHDHGMLGLVQCIVSPDPSLKCFRLNSMPKTMLEERWERDDFAHDPVVGLCARITDTFTWAEANAVANKRGRHVSAVCKEHTGQGNGLAFPISYFGMRRGCGSVGLDRPPEEFSPTQIMTIRHVVTQAYIRVDQLLGPFAPDEIGEPLSPREIDVLQRIANGMTAAQAASDIGIAPQTALDYLERAKRKTGTRKTPHTVKVALTQGLMLP